MKRRSQRASLLSKELSLTSQFEEALLGCLSWETQKSDSNGDLCESGKAISYPRSGKIKLNLTFDNGPLDALREKVLKRVIAMAEDLKSRGAVNVNIRCEGHRIIVEGKVPKDD